MQEPNQDLERQSDVNRRARPSFSLAALLTLAACGGGGEGASSVSPTDPTSVASTSSVANAPTVDVETPQSLSRCADVPPRTTDVVTTLDPDDQQAVLDAVLDIWQPEGPESEFAGIWSDREALGTLVVAVTDDPEPHRAAIAERLGGSTEGFDVVQVEYSERQLIDATSIAFGAAADAGIEVVAAAFDVMRNRVRVEALRPVTDDDIARVAAAIADAGVEPLAMVCIEAPTPDEMPPVIEPGTELDVIGSPDGDAPGGVIVSCHGIEFALATLGSLAPVLELDGDLREVARPHLGGDGWAPELWRYAEVGENGAIFFGVTTGVSIHTFDLGPNGWIWADGVSGGICDLEATLPAGLNVVDWELDPGVPAPETDSTELVVLATERDCASGQPMGERLLGPQVVETDVEVLIVFAAIAQLGDQNCPGNPSTPVTVELDAPLGDRTLRDGLLVGPITDVVAPAG